MSRKISTGSSFVKITTNAASTNGTYRLAATAGPLSPVSANKLIVIARRREVADRKAARVRKEASPVADSSYSRTRLDLGGRPKVVATRHVAHRSRPAFPAGTFVAAKGAGFLSFIGSWRTAGVAQGGRGKSAFFGTRSSEPRAKPVGRVQNGAHVGSLNSTINGKEPPTKDILTALSLRKVFAYEKLS
jgi:hypothetical protein